MRERIWGKLGSLMRRYDTVQNMPKDYCELSNMIIEQLSYSGIISIFQVESLIDKVDAHAGRRRGGTQGTAHPRNHVGTAAARVSLAGQHSFVPFP